MARPAYVARLVDSLLAELLDGLPALMLVGPRATGKTTTARRLGASIMRLDRPAVAGAVRADPDAALAAFDEPTVIDEWQLAPEILGAVKRAVDDQPTPNRFVLTGSVGSDLTAAGWPATGRVVRIPLWGLSERELTGKAGATPVVSRLFEVGLSGVRLPADVPDVRGYVERALRGGFPEVALQPSGRIRQAWLASYVDQLVARDVALASPARDPVRLRRYLRASAANTAGVVEHKTLYDTADLNRVTATAYDDLLQALFVVEHVPAWSSSRAGRMVARPKRYLTEPALLGPLLGVDARAVLRDVDLLGRVVDTFVAAQVRSELVVSEEAPRLFHLREPHGRHEIDLLAEAADGRVLAFEVKAGASPTEADARHLVWLRDQLGDRFVLGVVWHTGPVAFGLDDRIAAIPICALWG